MRTLLLSLSFLYSLLSCAESASVRQLIEKGKYQEAKEALHLNLEQDTLTFKQRADIYKYLGTVYQKLEYKIENFSFYFQAALRYAARAVDNNSEQSSVINFQYANSILHSAYQYLRHKRLSGLNNLDYFEFLKRYLKPCELLVEKASSNYPTKLKADVMVLEAGLLKLNKLLLRSAGGQNVVSYDTIVESLKSALDYEKAQDQPRHDLINYIYLSLANIYVEQHDYSKALLYAENAGRQSSGNHEIDLTARLFICLAKIEKSQLSPEVEKDLLDIADSIEKLKGSSSVGMTFQTVARFYSSRVAVYELLLRYYQLKGQPEKMLTAVERMKSRAFKKQFPRSQQLANLNFSLIEQRLKDENAMAFTYFFGPDTSWVICLSKNRSRVVRLDTNGQYITENIQKIINGYKDSSLLRSFKFRSDNPKYDRLLEVFSKSHEMYNLLVKPIREFIGKGKPNMIYVIPHNLMNYLSIGSVVEKLNKRHLLKSRFFLEGSPPISYLPTLSMLQFSQNGKVPSEKACIFSRSVFSNRPPFFDVDLPNVNVEVKLLNRYFETDAFTESRATEENLRNAPEVYHLRYFATHGIFTPNNPGGSHLLLSSSDSTDGKLTVYELINDYRTKLKANLTILSACNTALGELAPLSGDDLTNLSRAFIIAGSRGVLTSLWEAFDNQQPVIFEEFLKSYKVTNNAALSLDKSLKSYISKPSMVIYRHPIFWGNLILTGLSF